LTDILDGKYNLIMTKKKKPITVAEAGRRGGISRAKKYPADQLRKWASLGGWPKGRPRKQDLKKEKGEE
jgi:hypothetical protein